MNWRNWTGGMAAAVLLAGAQMAWGAYGGSGTFTKITSRADLTDGYYVIASSNGLAAMTHTNNGTYFTNVVISPVANTLTDPVPAIVWLVQTNASYGGHTIFSETSNRYVVYAGSANAAYAAAAVGGTTGAWTFAYGAGAFDVANVASSTRLLQYNSSAPRFACYTTTQQKLALYKMSSSTAPAFTSGTGPYGATSQVAMAFTVTASGSPAPTLVLQGTTASSGYSFTAGTGQLSYTPPPADGGNTRTFTFTASNSAGVATQTVSVAVTASAAPSFTSGTSYGATSLVAMAFTVAASGTPAPALALQSEDAAGSVDFTPGTGALDYTPATNDVGARAFTFTASNVAGVVTQVVTVTVIDQPVAPSFTSGSSYGATSLVAMAFTVTASGNPAPVLALQSENAAGTVSFTAGTGVLDYTPATNDVGNRSFVFTASNSAGVATQTVGVTVAAALTGIPTVSITNITTNAFTVNWTACTGASNYQVQVATDTNFTVGGGGSNVTITSVGNTGVSNDWAYVNGASNAGTYHKLVSASAPGVVSAEFSTLGYVAVTAGYAVATYGGATANTLLISYSLDSGSNWTVFATNTSATSSTYVTGQLNALPAAALGQSSVRIKWHCDVATASVGLRLQSLIVTGSQSDGGGSLVAEATTAALTYNATDLVMETTYYVRARMLTSGEWSTVVSATTASPAPTVPAFGANPGPLTVTTGVARVFTVTATGYPAPTLALQSNTASSGFSFTAGTGQLTYTAPEADLGARTFTFTASNATGVATQTVSVTVVAVTPTFGANPGPLTATATLARVFTVSASGNPTPTLALADTTASSGYSFTAGTGQLSYTPPGADVGARTFTFTASNVAGVATQVVSVTVAAAPAYIPTLTVTNIGTNSFTANWTEVTDATTYEIQIGTDTNFTGATTGTNILNENFNTLTSTTVPSGWSSSTSSSLAYFNEPYVGLAAPAYMFSVNGQTLTSPAFSPGATNLQFWAYGLRSGNSYTVSGLVSGVWTLISSVSISRNEAIYNVPLNPQTTQIKIRFVRSNGNAAFDDVVIQSEPAAGTLVLDETVAALTYGATDLDLLTAYYVRVRAAPTGTWSTVVQATTLGTDPVAPWFTSSAGPYSTTAGVGAAFTVSAMGVPAPDLALQDATATDGSYAFTPETGYLAYTPPLGDTGTRIFAFIASNTTAVVTQTVTVTVAAATAPVFTSGTAYSATTLVSQAFIVEATGTPAPVLALQGTTASGGYSFIPETGWMDYLAPTSDVGVQTFTFSASNLAGVTMQTVTVSVVSAPPVIDPIVPQSTKVGLELSYTVTATDPDTPASNLTFSCTSAVDIATWDFDPNTGDFYFIPTTNQIGTNNLFTFTASDGIHTSDPVGMVVVVNNEGTAVAVSFGKTRIIGEEGGAAVLIPVNLAYTGTATVSVRFVGPTNGTARWGTDFTCSTNLTINNASSGNVVMAITDDVLPEGPESIRVELVPQTPAYAGTTTQAVLHIRDNDAFSVMAANISDGGPQKYGDAGARVFEALCPDVVMIQEFNMTNGITRDAWIDAHFGTNYEYYVENGSGDTIPNGVISRYPVMFADEWTDTTGGGGNRDFAWATIDLPGTQDLHVVSVHLYSDNSTDRNTEAKALTNYITSAGWKTNGYVVVGGDFNTVTRSESAISTISSVVTDARKPADQDNDSASQYTSANRNYHYDYVLPSTNLNARHRTFNVWGYSFTNGMVFDTRSSWVTWGNGLPPSTLNSDATNFQHMAIVKVFELERDATADPPAAFSATPAGASQVDVDFTRNTLGDDVIVVWNGTGTFTAPTGTAPAVGAAFADGTVLYKGSVSPQSHTGLTSCTAYYYKCWSYDGTAYSETGLTAFATTPEPAVPAAVWASATNNEAFTAAWSAVAGAASYQLDVCAVPSFSGAGPGWGPIFRETMGTPTAGTTELAIHEASDGFDNDAYTMSSGGADNPADVRTSTVSTNYTDPAGNAASGSANIYFSTTGVSGVMGFAVGGIDTRGYEELRLHFGYLKESATTNMNLAVDWSTDGGDTWHPLAVSNLPAAGAAAGWYMVSNLSISASALDSTNLSLRWVRQTNSVPGRIDDVLLQGYADTAAFVAGYSNRTVTGATSQSVTGLTGDVTYYFRVRAMGGCASAYSPTASATPAGTPAAPIFTSGNSFGATTGVARTFTVTASGYPQPVLALQGTTASGGYSFTAGSGQLTYTPPEADAGSRSFTFRATNIYGTAMQTVTVAVAAGVPAAPAAVWASATNATGFTAAWSASALATGYRLDVSTESTFQVLTGGGTQSVLATNAATDVSLIAGDWTGTALAGTNGYVQMLQATSEIVSPAFSTAGYTNLTVDFWGRTYNGVTASNITVSVSTNNGGTWTVLGVVNPPNGSSWTEMPALSAAAYLGHAQTRIRWQSLDATGAIGVGVRSLAVNGWGPAYAPSFVAGWSNAAVAGTSQAVSGLAELTPYYFRVRAENAAGTSGSSPTAGVTTLETLLQNQTIDFPALGDQVATNVLRLAAIASSGLPVSFAVTNGPGTISGGTNLSFTGAGSVSVVASQAGNESWNPAPNVTHTFNVAKAAAPVQLQGLSQTYDGTARTVTVTTAPSGLAVDLTYAGNGWAPTNAGSYAMAATVNDPAYQGATNGTLEVSPAGLTVTADAQRKACGATNPPLTFQYSGFVNGESVAALAAAPAATTAVDAATAPGVYPGAITFSGGSAANYAFSYVAGDFTVTEAIRTGAVSATNSNVTLTFGPLASGSNYVLEYRASLMTGDWVNVTNMVGAGEASATLTHVNGAANFGYYRIEGVAGPTVKIWGYAHPDKPGNGKLNVIGVPFVTSNQTLNSLMDPLQFSGHYNNAGQADQLMMWNPATTAYMNLALYDLRAFGAQYATNTGWKAVAGFGPGAAYTNPMLPAGSAVWIRGATTNDRQVAIAGEVVMAGAATNAIVTGLQLVANPFSEQVALSNLTVHVNAEGHYNNAGQADQIMVWNAASQTYQNLALYDLRSFGAQYAYLTGWKPVSGFGPTSAYVNVTLNPGQGFWFKAVNGSFQWVEPNDYQSGVE